MKRDKRSLPMGPGYPHYPNKEEGKALRRLMAISGDSKEEVLTSKRNRRIISEAKKSCGMGDRDHRIAHETKKVKRWIAEKLGVPVYHPTVNQQFHIEYVVSLGTVRRRMKFRWGY